MLRSFLDRLGREAVLVRALAGRDRAGRLLAGAVILPVLWHAGPSAAVPVLLTALALLEGAGTALAAAAPAVPAARPARLLAAWLVDTATTACWLWPGVILAGHPSVPVMLAGLLWILGMGLRTATGPPAATLAGRLRLLPAVAVAAAAFGTLRAAHPAPAADWLALWPVLGLGLLWTVQALRRQGRARRALDSARDEALRRLGALEEAARRDPLTGLLTGEAFKAGLTALMARMRHRRVAVLFLDIDDFKAVNDTRGHAAGDLVLRIVARRLQRLAPGPALVARLGGDEFILALPAPRPARELGRAARRIAAALAEPVLWEGEPLRITASIGIALARPGLQSPAGLIAAADRAMYRAKAGAARRIAFHHPGRRPRGRGGG